MMLKQNTCVCKYLQNWGQAYQIMSSPAPIFSALPLHYILISD